VKGPEVDEVSTWIAAPRERVWTLVTDVTGMGRWSPECTGGRWTPVPGPAASFVGTNRHGPFRWTTHCTVVRWEEPSVFAFNVAESQMRWGYRLADEGGGTRLTEWREHIGKPALWIRAVDASGLLGLRREKLMVEGMRVTVARIKQAAEGAPRPGADTGADTAKNRRNT
jgi:uncharacterized protein YndB with AHSA1/START domain